MAKHHLTGKKGEEIALALLKNKGYSILEKNWRYQKAEIDLIVEKDNTLIIVEVKTRTSEEFESPKEAVTLSKQRHIIRAANAYIAKNDIDLECRFDIISVLILNKKETVEHIEDAFYPLL